MASFYRGKDDDGKHQFSTKEDFIEGYSFPTARTFLSQSLRRPGSSKLIRWLLLALVGTVLLSFKLRFSRDLWSEKPAIAIDGAEYDLAQLETRTLTKFDTLVMKKKIVYKDTRAQHLNYTGFLFEFRIVPMLRKMPALSVDVPESPKKGGPFVNPEPDELVATIGDSHRLLLKKYSVYRPELVLPTTTFGLQTDDLDIRDISAMWTVLQEFTLFPSIAIYNCGVKAGSSQAHKHMEFIPLPDYMLWPARANSTTDVTSNIKRVPFQHFVLGLPVGATPDDVFKAYETLLDRSRRAVRAANVETSDYNFIMTTHWVAIIPRRSAGPKGPFGAGAAGMLGMVSIPSYYQRKWWRQLGYTKYLKQLGIPKHYSTITE